jgi:NADPH-dependent 2,4-dienoyl-CoA reductase/sulfur reductase-like enzyme
VDREQVVVVGAGVAGASAAIEAAKLGLSVTLVDEHPLDLSIMAMDAPYFFGSRLLPTLADRGLMLERILDSDERLAEAQEAGATVLLGTCAWGSFGPGENSRHLERPCVGLADGERSWMLEYEHLILATGARDLVLSFPGWELAGVLGARGAIALMTRYQALAGRRLVILGSGDLGLETARLALERGLEVAGIVDVSPAVRGQAELWARLAARGVPFFGAHTVEVVWGQKEVDAIRLVRLDAAGGPVAGTQQTIACDTVCLALGLVPSVDLAYLAGCRMSHVAERGGWIPDRDGEMRTSVDRVYVVGDGAGVLEHMVTTPRIAVDQGRVAAIAVAETRGALSSERARALKRELSTLPDGAGAPGRGADPGAHAWLKSLVAAGGMDVVVCQCEGVTRQELVDVSPPRYLGKSPVRHWETKLPDVVEAAGAAHPDLLKRLTRAGMGHCQGRRCREQVAMLLAAATGVDVSRVPLASYRPPVRPVPMRILADQDESLDVREKWASWFSPWISVDVSSQP